MSLNPDLNQIFDRIANEEATAGDIQTLRQLLDARQGQNSIQIGKYHVNITEGRDIQIGDRIYQGTNAEAIKEALRLVLQEKQKAQRPRSEKLLLQAVREEVAARLKQSLHNAVFINLGKEAQPEQVNRPWSSDIKIGDNKREPIPDDMSILEVFDREEIAGKLLILGNPGAGKTTTMLDLAQALVVRSQEDCDYPIPVLFNLSTWKDDKQSIRDWLVIELKSKYGVRKDISTKWVDDTKLLPMLDGLDELESARQEPCVRKINDFLQSDSRSEYLIVSSRIEEYEKSTIKLLLNGAISLQNLDKPIVQKYLQKLENDELRNTIISDETFLELLQTPFWLTILIVSESELLIKDWLRLSSPEKRLECLLDTYTRRMLEKDIPKLAYSKYQNPTARQTRLWLVYLARQLNRDYQTELLIENIQPIWLITKTQKRIYKLIFEWCGLIFGLPLFFLNGSIHFESTYTPYYKPLINLNLRLKLRNREDKEIKTFEAFKWSWEQAMQGLFVGLIFGLLFGITSSVFFGSTLFDSLELQDRLIDGFIIGLIYGVSVGLKSGITSSTIETKIIPNQGIWKSAKNACLNASINGIAIGLMLGAIAGLRYGITFGLIYGLIFGLPSGIVSALIGGGQACIQHFILRLILYRNNYIPWNYARFLDYCTERLLLQRVGGRYRFIHRLLQEHFAAMPLDK